MRLSAYSALGGISVITSTSTPPGSATTEHDLDQVMVGLTHMLTGLRVR